MDKLDMARFMKVNGIISGGKVGNHWFLLPGRRRRALVPAGRREATERFVRLRGVRRRAV